MGMFLEASGCGESTTNGLGPKGQIVKVPLQSGKNLHYNGPNLAGSGVKTCDDLNTALSKIDAILLELRTDMSAVKQTLNLI